MEVASRHITQPAVEQAFDLHRLKAVCKPGAAAAEESRVAALKCSMDQAEDAVSSRGRGRRCGGKMRALGFLRCHEAPVRLVLRCFQFEVWAGFVPNARP